MALPLGFPPWGPLAFESLPSSWEATRAKVRTCGHLQIASGQNGPHVLPCLWVLDSGNHSVWAWGFPTLVSSWTL